MESIKYLESISDLEVLSRIKITFDKTEMLLNMKVLYERYSELVYKMKNKLYRIAKDNKLSVDTDDYAQEAFFRFVGAIRTCRLNELLARTDKWSFYFVYWGYLSSLNRDILNRARKEKNNTEADIILYEDGDESSKIDSVAALRGSPIENALEENAQKVTLTDAIDLCMTKHFTHYQKQIWMLKEQGAKPSIISEETKLSQNAIKEELIKMKDTLTQVLKKQAEESDMTSNYLKHLETIQII
jgi:DNA-directed RNA polymerase specialized sigma24 family protein